MVDYPLFLNLSNYVLMDNNNSNYELFSVILHNGTMNNGHYRAMIKKYDNFDKNTNSFTNNNSYKWYMCDDDSVNIINENEVLNHRNAYILFYQCQ